MSAREFWSEADQAREDAWDSGYLVGLAHAAAAQAKTAIVCERMGAHLVWLLVGLVSGAGLTLFLGSFVR